MALIHWLQLSLTAGIGPILTRRLVTSAGGAEAAVDATPAQLATIDGIGKSKSAQIARALRAAAPLAQEELERSASSGISILCPDDQAYPTMLGAIPDPPSVIYLKGSLQPRDLNGLAIVGSRKCSLYGREQAERFAAALAGAGFTVVSGGARGIDSAAHRGAISQTHGRTIAVLGCGVDQIYPPENASLFAQIAERGAVVSEFPLGSPPVPENFPRRNRIVSGLSRGVLVVEADVRSGALITARQACDDQNRPVFAIPGRIDHVLSAGPHKLIRDGAVMVTCLEDILEALVPLPAQAREPELFAAPAPEPAQPAHVPLQLTDRQQAVLNAIELDPTSIDSIIERTTLPAEQVLQELTLLTLKGAVKRVDGQSYVRR